MTIDNYGNVGIGVTEPNENLHVAGNIQVDGNLNIEGDLTYINTQVLEIEDPNIFLARNNPSDSIDIGMIGQYVDGGVTKYTGLFRDASGTAGNFKFFYNLEEKPTTTVNTSGTGYRNGRLQLEGLSVDAGITFTTSNAFIYEDHLILDSRSGDGNGNVGIGLTSLPLDSMDINKGMIIRNGNLKIGITDSLASVHINRSDIMVIPVGDSSNRLNIKGGIRYNSENDEFEGYNGIMWSSMGGIKDLDKDTYISLEDGEGIDNDEIKFYTDGSQRMIIKSDGSFGIRTDNPLTSFHMNSTDGIVIPIGDNSQRIDITGNIRLNSENNSFEGFKGGAWGSLGGIIDTDKDTYITAEDDVGTDNDDLKFFTAGSQKMIIDQNGRVGIGITNPTYKLEIDGDCGFHGDLVPKADETYDLGSTSAKWRDLFLSGDSIILGNTKISEEGGGLNLSSLSVTYDINNKRDILVHRDVCITRNLHCTGTIYGWGDLTVIGDVNINSLNITGDVDIKANLKANTLDITGHTELNDTLRVRGDAFFDQDVVIDSHLMVHGTMTTVNTEVIVIEDPALILAGNNIANFVDLGFYGKYIISGVTRHVGLIKDVSQDTFRLFSTGESPDMVFDVEHSTWKDEKLIVGEFIANDETNIFGDFRVDSDLLMVDVSEEKIGINNLTPETTLHIKGTDAIVLPIGNISQRLDITGSIRYNSESGSFEGYTSNWTAFGGSGVSDADQDTYIEAEYQGTDNDDMKFVTAGFERMRIDSVGNIGIGTISSVYPLHIDKINLNNWSTRITNSNTEVLICHADGQGLSINSGIESFNNVYLVNVKNSTTNIFTVMNTEKVGIKNNNPQEILDVSTTSFSEGANIGYSFIGNSSNLTNHAVFSHKSLKANNDEFAIQQDNNGLTTLNSKTDLKLSINNNEKIIIKSDGRIGMKTNTPSENIELADNTLISSTQNISLTVTNNLSDIYLSSYDGSGILVHSGTTENYSLKLKENNNDLFQVKNNGHVIIGITDTDSKLSIEDNLKINHNESFIKLNTTDNLNTINSNVPLSLGVSSNNLLYINDQNISINSNNINYQDFNVNGKSYISDALLINTTSSSYQLDVSGDSKLNGDVVITGLLTFEGVAVDGLEFQDSLIHFGNQNTDNNLDFGIYGQYVESLTTKYAGIIKDASDNNKFKIFKDLETEPSTNVDFTDVNINYADLVINNLEANGNIGINITNPQYSLHINTNDAIIIPVGNSSQRVDVTGAIRYNSEIDTFEGFKGTWGSLGGVIDVDQDTYVSAETSAGIDNDELKFVTAGLERMIVDSNGNVGIGITNPSYSLDVDGIIQSNDEILAPEFTTACDIRVKENIKRMDISNILEKVNKLNLYEYNYTDNYNKSNEKIYGLIAQNVNEVLPEAIKYKKMKVGNKYIDDFQTISQNTIISSLIGCIHELTDNQIKLGNELVNMKKDYYELKDSLILLNELKNLRN
jgi:cytoskeletal protein CcmA (bactofilin family)